MLFFPLIDVKMPTIVGILTFMRGENFMLNGVEHEKSFITSGPGCLYFICKKMATNKSKSTAEKSLLCGTNWQQ